MVTARTFDPRRSGRTTRMLQHAIELQQQRRAVYVLGWDGAQADTLRDSLQREWLRMGGVGDAPQSIKFESLQRPEYWNLQFMMNLRIPGAWPNCVWLVDHYAIERFFRQLAKLQEMGVAYDPPIHLEPLE